MRKISTVIWRDLKNQEVCLPSNIKILKQSEADQKFHMDSVNYIKPLLMFVHHLDLYFLQLEHLVTNLQNFSKLREFLNSLQLRLMNLLSRILLLLLKKLYIRRVNFSWAALMLIRSSLIYLLKRPLIYVPICFIVMSIL